MRLTFVRAKNLNHKYIGREIRGYGPEGVEYEPIESIQIKVDLVFVAGRDNEYRLKPDDKLYLRPKR